MLRTTIQSIADDAGATEVAVSLYDWESETGWSYRGGRWFHAASTIKLAILLAVHRAAAEERFSLASWLHVRNRFLSLVGGEPYTISRARDADGAVYARLGRLMRIGDLARHMIVTSSNLATNLLLDLVGVEAARRTLAELGLDGVDLVRGVEDERAFQIGRNNRVTADGLVRLLRAVHDRDGIDEATAEAMHEVLLAQELKGGLRLGLPDEVRERAQVAHKTGEISAVAHDAGIVTLPDRRPYALAVLTGWPPDGAGRQETVGRIARAVHDALIAPEPEG